MAKQNKNLKVTDEALGLAQAANYYHGKALEAGRIIVEHEDVRDNLPEGHSTIDTLNNGISRINHRKDHAQEQFENRLGLASEQIPAQGPDPDSKSVA